jgi:hypothetical protein
MKPECQHTQAWLLETEEADRISADARMVHLSGCDECQSYSTALREVNDGLKSLPQPEVPPALEAQVLARVFSPPSRRSWFGNMTFSWRFASLALVPVLALVVGTAVLRHQALRPSLDADLMRAEAPRAGETCEADLKEAPAPVPNSGRREELDSVGLSALGTGGGSSDSVAARASKKKEVLLRAPSSAETRAQEEAASAALSRLFRTPEERDRGLAVFGESAQVGALKTTEQPSALSDTRTEAAPTVAIRVLGADSPDTRYILEFLFGTRGPALARQCPVIANQDGAKFDITIDAEGRLSALKPSSQSTWSPQLLECVTAEVGRWKFPIRDHKRQARLQVHRPTRDPKTP